MQTIQSSTTSSISAPTYIQAQHQCLYLPTYVQVHSLSQYQPMELFSWRRWATGSAQQSNSYGIMPCMCCIIFLGLTQTQQLFAWPIQPSSPATKELHDQPIYVSFLHMSPSHLCTYVSFYPHLPPTYITESLYLRFLQHMSPPIYVPMFPSKYVSLLPT